jgi:hypothetical protein
MPDVENPTGIDYEGEAKKLRKHFSFTEADLMANHSGVLSEKQKQRFEKEERGGRGLGLLIGGTLLVLSIGLIPALFLFDPRKLDFIKDTPGAWWPVVLLVGGAGLLFALVLLGLAGGGIYLIVSQLFMGKKKALVSVRGEARLTKGIARGSNRRSSVYHDLHIGDQEFDGDAGMDQAIIRDAEYVVYYIEGINEIMSVELVGAGNP